MYFAVDKFPLYGQLSGRKLEDNRAGERVAVDSRKKNPADFALWKVSVIENNADLRNPHMLYQSRNLQSDLIPDPIENNHTWEFVGLSHMYTGLSGQMCVRWFVD